MEPTYLDELREAVAERYAIEDRIGEGGMAIVYRATDLRHDRAVAIKVLRPELAYAISRDRFLREIRVTARLTHPHILPLLDSGETLSVLYYVMPYMTGPTLATLIDKHRHLSLTDALRIFGDVASALDYAHRQGIVHRDIKPSNILIVDRQGVVSDFGIALALDVARTDSLTGTGIPIGTPAYMSPEQVLAAEDLDARSDVYALGCMLYEMLCGVPPFRGLTPQAVMAKHVTEAVPSIRSSRPGLPRTLERALLKSLAKEPSGRFSTAAEFANALAPYGAEDGVSFSSRAETMKLAAPNLGTLVDRLCNRWKQVNDFDAHLRRFRQEQPGRPQVYVVHGDEHSGHGSLVERLVHTRLRHLAEERSGLDQAGLHHVKCPWPMDDSLSIRKRDLVISLFREIDPAHLEGDLSAEALLRLPGLSLRSVLVLEHDVRGSTWDPAFFDLLEWYRNGFWRGITSEQHQPQVVVFLKVVFPGASKRRGLLRLFRPARHNLKNQFLAALEDRQTTNAWCPWAVLDELQAVTLDDVVEWFNKNHIYESELRRHEIAETIFSDAPAKPMAVVEAALARIHREFLDEYDVAKGYAT